ncbi:hypothetical protein NQ318_011378 [Aromia moschata]|uniref:UDP-glucuronosyltransferase n=1 Tax=Aromia moschata TaxID=1265417 RepID=A0AAV8YT36_9CUCU|nr:hypothetical protein NQ318_011378 [Aromia moschata]
MVSMLASITDRTFSHTNVHALLNSGEKFDVVIVEQFANDAMKIFAHHFNAPLIVFSSIGPNDWVNKIVGNPSPSSYIPHMTLYCSSNMTFFPKIDELTDLLYVFPKHSQLLKKHFPYSPDFYEVYYNTSLVLLNSHESMYGSVPLVPSMIEIGGFHVAPPKKLPKDLQDYLDNASEGIVFSKLKEKVLWKWEDDVLPGQPPNVKLGKWFPQQDILAHPNVKVFITHGGLLSTTETVYHGVPILAIPVFADQHHNAATAVRNGYALSLAYHDPKFSEENLLHMLKELLYNPTYRDNVKQRSELFHDRPQKPMDAAVYWVEYVVRNKGASHLRVAGVGMPWYKYHLVDVIAFLAGVTISTVLLLCFGIRWLLCRRSPSAKKNKLKQN